MSSNTILSESMTKAIQVIDTSKSPREVDATVAAKYISPEKIALNQTDVLADKSLEAKHIIKVFLDNYDIDKDALNALADDRDSLVLFISEFLRANLSSQSIKWYLMERATPTSSELFFLVTPSFADQFLNPSQKQKSSKQKKSKQPKELPQPPSAKKVPPALRKVHPNMQSIISSPPGMIELKSPDRLVDACSTEVHLSGFEEEDIPMDGEFSEDIISTTELLDLQRPIRKKSQNPQAVFPVPSIRQATSSLPLSEDEVNTYKQQPLTCQ